MLPAKWVAALVFIYVIAIIACCVTTGEDIFADTNTTGPVQGMLSYTVSIFHVDFNTVSNPVLAWQFFGNLFHILMLDFPFFHSGPWVVLRWVILGPIIALVVYGIASAFFQVFQRNI